MCDACGHTAARPGTTSHVGADEKTERHAQLSPSPRVCTGHCLCPEQAIFHVLRYVLLAVCEVMVDRSVAARYHPVITHRSWAQTGNTRGASHMLALLPFLAPAVPAPGESVALAAPRLGAGSSELPNILMVLSDDHGHTGVVFERTMSRTAFTLAGPAKLALGAPQLTHNRPRARIPRPHAQFPPLRPHGSLLLALLPAAALLATQPSGPAPPGSPRWSSRAPTTQIATNLPRSDAPLAETHHTRHPAAPPHPHLLPSPTERAQAPYQQTGTVTTSPPNPNLITSTDPAPAPTPNTSPPSKPHAPNPHPNHNHNANLNHNPNPNTNPNPNHDRTLTTSLTPALTPTPALIPIPLQPLPKPKP